MIHITKSGQKVTKRKHIKATSITAEQYIWDQLIKNTVDRLHDILKYFEKQTQPNVTHSHNRNWRKTYQ